MEIQLNPAHREIIRRVALGHVELFLNSAGKTTFIGANRGLVE